MQKNIERVCPVTSWPVSCDAPTPEYPEWKLEGGAALSYTTLLDGVCHWIMYISNPRRTCNEDSYLILVKRGAKNWDTDPILTVPAPSKFVAITSKMQEVMENLESYLVLSVI